MSVAVGVDINEAGRRAAEQALAEVDVMKTSVRRFKGLVADLFACRDAGAQLPLDLIDQITAAMNEFLVELSNRPEGGLP